MAIPGSLLVASLGTFQPLSGRALVARNVDCRITILVLLVTLAVAFAAIVVDFEFAPAARLMHRVRTLVSFIHLPSPSFPLQVAGVSGGASAAFSTRTYNCITELTCSRLC
jgi:hypothetical protein